MHWFPYDTSNGEKMRCIHRFMAASEVLGGRCKDDVFELIAVDFASTLFVPNGALKATCGLNDLTSREAQSEILGTIRHR